jgi:hypothetical protein
MVNIVLEYDGFEIYWSELLTAGNGVHLALEKGAKDSPQSRQWFGAKKRERRLDPLLNYMLQARNAEEHGIHPVAVRGHGGEPTGLEAFKRGFAVGPNFRTREGVFGYFSTPEKAAVLWRVTPPDAELIPVHNDVFGQTFDPPTEHLGRPLKSRSPLSVGRLWLIYLRRLIREAEALAARSP